MGFYIQGPNSKVDHIIGLGATRMLAPAFLTGDRIAVCVDTIGDTSVATIVVDEETYAACNIQDGSHKVWLAVPRDVVIKECPEVEDHLPEDDETNRTGDPLVG